MKIPEKFRYVILSVTIAIWVVVVFKFLGIGLNEEETEPILTMPASKTNIKHHEKPFQLGEIHRNPFSAPNKPLRKPVATKRETAFHAESKYTQKTTTISPKAELQPAPPNLIYNGHLKRMPSGEITAMVTFNNKGKIARIGDTIDSYQIVSIDRDSVVFVNVNSKDQFTAKLNSSK